MPRPEWGLKRTCTSCEARFYDMKKKEPQCPVCGAAYDPITRGRRVRPGGESRRPKEQPEPAVLVNENEQLELETELDEDIDELDSDSDVVENVAGLDETC